MANHVKLLLVIWLVACSDNQSSIDSQSSAEKQLPGLPCGQLSVPQLIERAATQVHPLSIEANQKLQLINQIEAATEENIYEILESSGVDKLEEEAAYYREHQMDDELDQLIHRAELNMRSDTLRFITREQVPAVIDSVVSDFPNAHAMVQFESPFYDTGASMQLGGVGVGYAEEKALLDKGESVSAWRLDNIYLYMQDLDLETVQFLGYHHKGRLHMIGGRFALDSANVNEFLRRPQWDRGPQGIFAIELAAHEDSVVLTKIINDTSMNSNDNPCFFDHWVRLGLGFDAFSLVNSSQEFIPEWAFEG